MTRWEATYLGTQVAVAVASPEAYALLSEHDLVSWQAGGCAILAEALGQLLGAERYGLVRDDGVVDHVVAKLGGYYFDADGAYTGSGMCEKHEALEGAPVTLRRLGDWAAVPDGVFCTPAAVQVLVELLEDWGGRVSVIDDAWASRPEPHSFVYIGNCPQMTRGFVTFTTRCVWEMGQPDCEITYRTFARWAEPGVAQWCRELWGFPLSTDPYIAFYKSATPSGIPCVFFVWSHMEHFFIPDEAAADFDLAEETRIAGDLDY